MRQVLALALLALTAASSDHRQHYSSLERKEEERRFIEQRRKIDKAQLVDGFAKEFLLANTFKHEREQSERGGNRR